MGAAEKADTGKIKLKAPPYIYHGVTDKHSKTGAEHTAPERRRPVKRSYRVKWNTIRISVHRIRLSPTFMKSKNNFTTRI